MQALKEKSTESIRVLKEHRDTALEERAKMLQENNMLSQFNTDLCRTHKGVGEEASIRKDLKRVERERDDAREIVRALSDETESLRQNLQLSETRRVDAEENLLNSAEYDAELIESEHTRKLIAIGTRWGKRLKESLDQLRLQNEDTARGVSKEHELAMAEVTAGYMGEIRKREARDAEISKLKRKEAPGQLARVLSAKGGKPSFYQETNEDEEAARSRERHMADLKESQSRRREADERLRRSQQLQARDDARKDAEAKEDQQ